MKPNRNIDNDKNRSNEDLLKQIESLKNILHQKTVNNNNYNQFVYIFLYIIDCKCVYYLGSIEYGY